MWIGNVHHRMECQNLLGYCFGLYMLFWYCETESIIVSNTDWMWGDWRAGSTTLKTTWGGTRLTCSVNFPSEENEKQRARKACHYVQIALSNIYPKNHSLFSITENRRWNITKWLCIFHQKYMYNEKIQNHRAEKKHWWCVSNMWASDGTGKYSQESSRLQDLQ